MFKLFSQFSFQDISPSFERILMISWLLKDFGWMTADIYFGFSFGVISMMLHGILVLIDPRKSFRYYNMSLFIWVCANFIWMTLEFTCNTPSTDIRVGPPTPLGGIDTKTQNFLIDLKSFMFFFAAFIQLFMYVGIYFNKIEMPEDEGEDMIAKNELHILLRGQSYKRSSQTELAILGGETSIEKNSHDITLAFIENGYIIFWISKDLFWSWGTGDLTKGRDLAIMYETIAMLFGTFSILIYVIISYIYRRKIIQLLDCITTICWISANYVWMCGEFFLRYDDLAYDDSNEGNDWITRVCSACFFTIGLSIQFSIIIYLSLVKYDKCVCQNKRKSQFIEMFTFGPMLTQVTSIDYGTSYNNKSNGHVVLPHYEETESVLF